MSALKSQSSLLRFGFGQTKDTVPGLVDPNLPKFGPKPKPVSKHGPDRPRKEAQPDNEGEGAVRQNTLCCSENHLG